MVVLSVLCLVGCLLLSSVGCPLLCLLCSYSTQDDDFDRNDVEQARRFLDSKRTVYRHVGPLRSILPIGLRDPAQVRRQALDTNVESSP